MPLALAHRAISAFPKRAKMCSAANGGPSKHNMLAPDLMTYPIVSGHDGEEAEGDDRDRIVIHPPSTSWASICI